MLRLGLLLAVAAMVVAGAGGLVLAWDGAWFVLRTFETGTPTFLHGRVVAALVQAPAILVGRLDGDAGLATVATGLAYAALPLVAIGLTWRVTRPDRDDLFAVAMLGILLAALPGRAFLISEAMVAVDLGWPLLTAAALGRVRRHRVLVTGVIVGIALAHPFGLAIVALAAGVAWIRAILVPGAADDRRTLRALTVLAVAVIAAGILRSALVGTGYEASTLDAARLVDHLRGALGPRPLLGVVAAIVAATCVAIPRGSARLRGSLAVAAIAVGALALLPWAADPARWERALQFRTLALAVQLPLLGLLCLTAIRDPRAAAIGRAAADTSTGRLPGFLVVGAGSVALAVLAVQTVAWRGVLDDAAEALRAAPPGCVASDELPVERTALDHWGVTAAMLLAEAPRPRHLVLTDRSCVPLQTDLGRGLPIKVLDGVVADRVEPDGPLDLRPLLDSLR